MTIKDIAAKCGVSVSTVSRVLNNHPYVKEELREKVLSVIEEEHFVPHDGAVSLVKSREDAIGVIVRGTGNVFFSTMTPIMEKTANKLGYNFFLDTIHTQEDELRAAASIAKSKKLKGVVLLGGRYDYSKEDVEILDVPFVCCTFTNSFGELSPNQFSSVCIDDRKEAFCATEYLIRYGHEKIAILLASKDDHSISGLRYKGFCEAMEMHGLTVNPELVVETEDFSMESAYNGVKKLIREGKDFTAIFAIADTLAMAAIKALDDTGRVVPKACSVISIDGIDMTNYLVPTLTAVVQPREDMAKKAVELLHAIIHDGENHSQVQVKTVIRPGASVTTPSI